MSKTKKQLTEAQVERRKEIIDTLKSMIFPTVLCLIILVGVLFIVNYQGVEEEADLVQPYAYVEDKASYVLENENLKLTLDPETTQFELLVKSSGKIWRSNDPEAADDTAALSEEKGKLQSPLLMSFATETGLETSYNTSAFSVANGIYEIEEGEDYLKVNYSLGNVEKEFTIPPVCTAADFEMWTDKMEVKEKNLVQEYYKKYNINKLGKKDNKEELLASYPIIENEIIYVLRDTTKESVRKQIEAAFEAVGYTYEDYLAHKELDLSEKSSDKPIFNVSVYYRLDGEDLLVEIPFSELDYRKEYPIYTITPLPYFGCGGKDDDGFMVVPEGGGAVINFNNGKVSQAGYYANMYGWDLCLNRDAVVHNTRAYFNAYGVSDKKNSFICILEDGKSYASVQADVSGKFHSYNYVNAIYSVCQREKYDVGDIANSDIYKYVEQLPDESIVQRYRFIDSGSYVDMAKNYGSYLKDSYGDYLSLNDDASTPVTIEIVGAVDRIRQICGVPVSKPWKLTTYKEAAQMIKALNDEGMDNMSVKLSGWANGGVNQKILKHTKLIPSLGSKKDLKNLSDTAKNLGVDLYLNGITQCEYDSNLLNGFNSYLDAAKFISKERAELVTYSAVTYAAREDFDPHYLLHTDVALKMADNLVTQANKYNAGAAFSDNGMDLASDYYKKNPNSRESVRIKQEEQFKNASDNGTKIMVNMGNDYAAPFADMVTNMDLAGSEYTILDAEVPFYQLALHGYLNYTGRPVNICGNDEEQVLEAAEYGAGLQFTLMKESAFALQKTLYTEYYGASYDAWHDRMMNIYNRYNSELGHVFNQEMVDHENITDTLSCTTYADGTKVYVNYEYADVNAGSVTVPARDYLVVR